MIEELKTLAEWKKLGIVVNPRCTPAEVDTRNGKEVKLYRREQGRDAAKPGERIAWTFQLVRAPSNRDWIDEQFRIAEHHALVLRKIETERRRDHDDIMRRVSGEYRDLMLQVDAAERAVGDLIASVRAVNARARRRVDTEEQRAEITAAKTARNALYTERSALVKKLYRDEAIKAATVKADTFADEQIDAARDAARDAGIGSGTLDEVKRGAADLRKGPPPNLRRASAESIYLQVSNTTGKPPLTWERILSGAHSTVRGQLDGKFATLQIRFGRAGDAPVECAFVMHRKRPNGSRGLPIGAIVKGIRLCRREVGYREEWSIVFSLERKGGFDGQPRAESGRVAVDVGYRRVEEGIRVAHWVGDDGRHGQVVIPEGRGKGLPAARHDRGLLDFCRGESNAVGYALHARTLQKIRDENFNAMLESLAAWRKGKELPDWLAEEAKVLHAVRSKERLLDLWRHWRENRFPDDDGGFSILSDWRHWKDERGYQHGELHLSAWEAEERAKFARWRKDYYRRFWAALRREYATAIFEDMRVSDLRNGNPDPDEQGTPGGEYAGIASLHLFRSLGGYLGATQRKGDPSVEYCEAKHTTARCHRCGGLCEWDHARHLSHTCEHCGVRWDQDYNACMNLLQEQPAAELVQQNA